METYRLSSRVREGRHEYIVQTYNDASLGSVATTVYVDGIEAETVNCPHPAEVTHDQMLSLVKLTHGEKKQELESLLKAYAQALEKDDSDLMYQLGTAFYYRRFMREARELFGRVVKLNPDHHQAWNFLGMTHLAIGEVDSSIEAATRAVEYRPGFADYRNNLGEAFLAAGDSVRAIGECEQAISINMYYGDAYFNLALAHLLEATRSTAAERTTHLVGKAVECLNKAGTIYPDYKKQTDYELGSKALQAGDFSRALSVFSQVREFKKERHRQEFAAYYMRFVLYPDWVTEKAVSDRIVYLEQELKRNPNYVDLQRELGECYMEKARITWHKAVKQFNRVAETHPGATGIDDMIDETTRLHQSMNGLISKLARKG